jgi:hypothetical protein
MLRKASISRHRRGLIVLLFLFDCFSARTQSNDSLGKTHNPLASFYEKIIEINPRIYHRGDTTWIYSGICKTLKTKVLIGQATMVIPANTNVPPLLKIHGTVQYDYLYRSFSDTPYYQKKFKQHTILISLVVTIKDKYPFRINFVVRKSNSPYFKNFFDGGLLFDRLSYYTNTRQQLLDRIEKQLPGQSYLDAAQALLKKQIEKYNALKSKLSSNGLAQQLIEEREKKYLQPLQAPVADLPGREKNISNSGEETLLSLVDEKRTELDSLQNNINKIRTQVDSIKNKMAADIALVRQKISKAVDPRELVKVSHEYGLEDKKDQWTKLISGIKSIGIGRSVLNYSELTARNVSLTGLNLEYNPNLYVAVTAGKIDYGFRDFFGRNDHVSNQYLLMGRFGIGDIEKKAIIFSLFTGRKTNYGSILSDTVNSNVLLTGYSIETILKKNAHTQFSAEIAKSTPPVTGRLSANKQTNKLFNLSDQSNLGISVKGETIIYETQTKLSAFFKKIGENFQSFSLFNYNTDQTAWMMKVEQPLFKNKIDISGTVRKNDFVNPFTEKTFKTNTVFSSIQLSVRIPKWPSINVGYYPGSQLYIIERNRVRENVYYILNGTIIHQYKMAGLHFVSSAIYNNYTSKGTDSGFFNYSGKSYMLSQSVTGRKLQLQGNYNYTDQRELQFYTIESNANYTFGTMLGMGAGIKYNKIITGSTYWGGTGQLLLNINRVGSLQLQYEKSFLPTTQQTLFPVEVGRLTLFKNF